MKTPKLSDLTISEVAEELRIRREHVVRLLESGALQGYDVTPPGAKRKSYRIPRQALDDFKAGRTAKQHKATRRRVKPTRDPNYVEYFS
jgi:excisionase family DNA binding protein